MKCVLASGAAALAAFLSLPSAAQTSTCYLLGNVSSCSVRSGGASDNPAWQRYSAFQELERQRNENQQRREDEENLAQARKGQELRETVGALVADGKCAIAKRAALQAGDFALAEQAASLCEPPSRAGH